MMDVKTRGQDDEVMTEPVADPRSFESDFYEEDEPIEKILAIFEQGAKGVTAPPEEAADDLVTVDPSPWLLGRTGRRYVGRVPVVRHEHTVFDLHLSGAASS
jgi:hypothetical protein